MWLLQLFSLINGLSENNRSLINRQILFFTGKTLTKHLHETIQNADRKLEDTAVNR